MNTTHNARPLKNPWYFRIRIALLIVLLTLGLGTAAIEKWRQDDFTRVGNRIHDKLAYFLNPVSERTHKILSVILKVNKLFKVEEENRVLQDKMTQLNTEFQLLAEQKRTLERMAGLARWSAPPDLLFLPADVTGLITSGQSAALIINRGRAEGVRVHDPVVALEGLVGIVQSVGAHTAKVQAITDPISNVGVMDSTSRARGVVMGRGRNELMLFMPENEVQPINIGGVLITSGFDNSVFPKGIVVGVIQDRKLDTYGMTYGQVKAATSFEALEEILLIIPKSRLNGMPDTTSATLGVKRIFMPNATLKADQADTITTTTAMGTTLQNGNAVTSAAQPLQTLEFAPLTTGSMALPNGAGTRPKPTPTPKATPRPTAKAKAAPRPTTKKAPAPPGPNPKPANGEIRPEDFR